MPYDRTPGGVEIDLRAVAEFLRRLAERVERDAIFGSAVAALLAESGLLAQPSARRGRSGTSGGARARIEAPAGASADAVAPMDPFAMLRQHGEAGLRTRLDALEVTDLRNLVRIHRLDPARISARWTNRERLVALIVDQVRARADHGKAFARI